MHAFFLGGGGVEATAFRVSREGTGEEICGVVGLISYAIPPPPLSPVAAAA